MKRLEAAGLVQSEGLGEGEWLLTSKAMHEYIEHSFWLSVPGQVFTIRPNVKLEDYTQLELQVAMQLHGWVHFCLGENDKLAREPHQPDGTKRWFSGQNGRFFSSYLMCLLKSEQLFAKGLQSLWHGQIDAYYTTLLTVLDNDNNPVPLQDIPPWKPVLG